MGAETLANARWRKSWLSPLELRLRINLNYICPVVAQTETASIGPRQKNRKMAMLLQGRNGGA
jgi:hypothetical protein